jgi:hypothetical protein
MPVSQNSYPYNRIKHRVNRLIDSEVDPYQIRFILLMRSNE